MGGKVGHPITTGLYMWSDEEADKKNAASLLSKLLPYPIEHRVGLGGNQTMTIIYRNGEKIDSFVESEDCDK